MFSSVRGLPSATSASRVSTSVIWLLSELIRCDRLAMLAARLCSWPCSAFSCDFSCPRLGSALEATGTAASPSTTATVAAPATNGRVIVRLARFIVRGLRG